MNQVYYFLRRLIASKQFLIFTFLWFTFQSLWMSLSNRFTIPHDEQYHFNITRIYSDQWLPFISNQPVLDNIGDTTRLTSYMYHYLMSFPLRVIEILTDDFKLQLLSMRFINIGLGILSLYLLYVLASKLTKSKAVINMTVFFVATTTVFVFISGGVNYDNLLLPVILTTFILVIRIMTEPANIKSLLLLACTVMFGVLVKFAYLPIALIAIAVIGVIIFKDSDKYKVAANKFLKKPKPKSTIILIILLAILSLLIIERHGYNTIKYKSFRPDCLQVQSQDVCDRYRPYARNQALKAVRDEKSTVGKIEYTNHWVDEIRLRTFGVYSGIATKPDLVVIKAFITLLAAVSLFTFVENFKSVIYRNKKLSILLIFSSFYVLVLYLKNLDTYYTFAEPLAIQGRYLIPVLPIVYLTVISLFLKTFKSSTLRSLVILASLFIFMLTGLVSYIALSDEKWWFDDTNTENINQSAQDILSPINRLR